MGQREDLAGLTGAEVVAMLGLEPLSEEGGVWREIWRDDKSTAIYFLLQPGDFSAMHRLAGPELWHHYAGAAVEMLLLGADGKVDRPVLGDDLGGGERPCVVVPGHTWMGASTRGEWSLVGTTMAPPYHHDGFELGVGDHLTEQYPAASAEIAKLVRM
ncbi:MAG: cupin domain-containing protein [Acidimicrobiia bacterium]|nr:cupin domain-containing protein [Acidimicrobiia bacterium]MCY4435024.1 cupin domain-containing protein [bacterium]